MSDSPAPNEEQGRPAPVPRPRPSLAVNLPREIGGYQIQRVLGSGGMATVYAALQQRPKRTVAIKVMKPGVSMARGDAAHRRFKREIEILGRLRHPYIAQVYFAGMHDEGNGEPATPFFVMEYVPSAKTITEYIASRQLDIRDRLKLFVKICAAVEHGHRHKIIHRDLKPANILIDENGDPKIIDFGVARATEIEVSSQTMHTESGRIIGTLQYMSPEQLDTTRPDLDARCDVYALGVLLYRILTGKPPHDLEALPVYEAARIIREESPEKPSEIKPEIRGDLETIILKAMAQDRSLRYRNAGSLGRDIIRFLAGKPIHARRASAWYRTRLFARRHRALLTSGSIIAMVMAIAAGIVLYDRSDRLSDRQIQRDATTSANSAVAGDDRIPSPAPPQTDAPRSPAAAQPTPTEVFPFSLHTSHITQLRFADDGKFLFSGGYDWNFVKWEVAARQPVATITPLDAPVRSMALSGNGKIIAIAAAGNTIWLCDTVSIEPSGFGGQQHRPTLFQAQSETLHAMTLNESGDRLALGFNDFTLRVHAINLSTQSDHTRVGTPDEVLSLRGSSGAFTCAAFSRDSALLAAGTQGGSVYLWNVSDGSLIARFNDLRSPTLAVAFTGAMNNEERHRVAAIAVDGTAVSWPLEDDDLPPAPFTAGRGPLVDAMFDAQGNWLACAGKQSYWIWKVAGSTPTELGYERKSAAGLSAIAIDSAGSVCALGHVDGDIAVVPLQ